MSNRDIVLEYLRCFCAGDVDGLEGLLDPDLHFAGTLHAFGSAAEYLDSLRRDPPEQCGCRLLSVTEGEDAVAVFYDYRKADGAFTVAQLFTLANGRICRILLVFDGRAVG